MAVQRVPLETLQKIRQYLQGVLALPESENHPKLKQWVDAVDELPEPESLDALGDLFNFGGSLDEETPAPNTEGKWFVSATNPGAALLKLPGLQLQPGLRIVSYLYRTEKDGMGVTWAVPESASTTAQLEVALEKSGNNQQPPKPFSALADVMEAIDGDRTPVSFIVASILKREFQEVGALGSYCNWSHHRLIASIPPQMNWTWRTPVPKDLSPKVQVLPDGKAAVEFFTCRVVPPVAIFQHVDQYLPGQYKATSLDRALAAGHRG